MVRKHNTTVHSFMYIFFTEPDWVITQTIERHRRQLEIIEAEYEARLTAARKKEAAIKKMAKAKVHKKPVRLISPFVCNPFTLGLPRSCYITRQTLMILETKHSCLKTLLGSKTPTTISHPRYMHLWKSKSTILLLHQFARSYSLSGIEARERSYPRR